MGTTWQRLLADESLRGLHRDNLEVVALAAEAPSTQRPLTDFEPASEALPATLVLDGVDACAPTLALLAPRWQAVARGFASVKARVTVSEAIDFAAIVNVGECCGAAAFRVAGMPVAEMIAGVARRARELEDAERFAGAFFALGAGDHEAAAVIAQGGPPEEAFAPGRRFAFDLQGTIVYLASAIASGAPPDDVAPAFRDLVGHFPDKLRAGQARWADLVWAARAYFHLIGGAPVGEVGARLHAFVRAH